jgi:hypothetical protein
MTANDCQLPGDARCAVATCTGGVCGALNLPLGTVVPDMSFGDCMAQVCDGAGNVISQVDDADVADDGNECTADICTNGMPSHAPLATGTICAGGPFACDAAGNCVAPPQILSVSPSENAAVPADTSITATFSNAMDPATLLAQTAPGACTGVLQVSANDFATCAGFASSAPAMTNGNATATWVPAPGLLANRTYKVRITTDARTASGLQLLAGYESFLGFITSMPGGPAGTSIMISQIFSGGGNSGSFYKNDFIELHNTGSTPIFLGGWSVQYLPATQSMIAWQVTALPNVAIQPGAYFLVQEAGGAGGSMNLPAPDATGSINMGGGGGNVRLVNSTTALVGCTAPGPGTVDAVAYGNALCGEGMPAPTPSSTLAIVRATACGDSNNNAVDFVTAFAQPRNSGSPVDSCGRPTLLNETGAGAEADYCTIQFPLSLSLTAGAASPLVYGQLYEAGVTEAPGVDPNVSAQLGFGPATANPEYQAGWSWVDAGYNVQVGNNDEYMASFTAPGAGDYRYAYRFSFDNGASWTYCDSAQGDFGAGSNPGLTFDLENLGVLNVAP